MDCAKLAAGCPNRAILRLTRVHRSEKFTMLRRRRQPEVWVRPGDCFLWSWLSSRPRSALEVASEAEGCHMSIVRHDSICQKACLHLRVRHQPVCDQEDEPHLCLPDFGLISDALLTSTANAEGRTAALACTKARQLQSHGALRQQCMLCTFSEECLFCCSVHCKQSPQSGHRLVQAYVRRVRTTAVLPASQAPGL